MNNYVTTNIRLPEDDYLRLKEEAARKRISLAAVIRDKIGVKKIIQKSPQAMIKKIRMHAAENALNLKEINIVDSLREMRYDNKW